MARPAKPMTPVPPAARVCARGALTIKRAARFSGFGRTELFAAIARGELEVIRRGKKVLIPRTVLSEWLGAMLEETRAARGTGART